VSQHLDQVIKTLQAMDERLCQDGHIGVGESECLSVAITHLKKISEADQTVVHVQRFEDPSGEPRYRVVEP
jgi:hypothetical protein